jgi:hypothetical protein
MGTVLGEKLNRKDWLSVAEWLGLSVKRINLYNKQ